MVWRLQVSIFVLLLTGVSLLRADATSIPPANVDAVRAASKFLALEIGNFEQYVVLGLQGDDSRALYKQADTAMGLLRAFNKDLKANASRAQLYKDFHRVSDQIDGAIKQITGPYSIDSTVWHLADRLKAAREELRYNLLLGDTDAGRSRELLQSQVVALVAATESQSAIVQRVLGEDPDQSDLLVAVKTLAQSSKKFQLKLAGGAMGDELQESFAMVSNAFAQVVKGLSRLNPGANPSLFRALSRTDAVFERVFKLMQARGARPSFQDSDF